MMCELFRACGVSLHADWPVADVAFGTCGQVDASQTRRYGGSGLGLAISQKLAEAMGGQMWAESHGLGMGSCFRWTIACRLPPPAAAARPQPAPTAAQRGLALPPKVTFCLSVFIGDCLLCSVLSLCVKKGMLCAVEVDVLPQRLSR